MQKLKELQTNAATLNKLLTNPKIKYKNNNKLINNIINNANDQILDLIDFVISFYYNNKIS